MIRYTTSIKQLGWTGCRSGLVESDFVLGTVSLPPNFHEPLGTGLGKADYLKDICGA
jgi:hypothetical protein